MSKFILNEQLQIDDTKEPPVLKIMAGRFQGYEYSYGNVSIPDDQETISFSFDDYGTGKEFDKDELTELKGDILCYLLALELEEPESDALKKSYEQAVRHFD